MYCACDASRKIGFDEFRAGVNALAKLKYPGKPEAEAAASLEEVVLAAGGPTATATVRDTAH